MGAEIAAAYPGVQAVRRAELLVVAQNGFVKSLSSVKNKRARMFAAVRAVMYDGSLDDAEQHADYANANVEKNVLGLVNIVKETCSLKARGQSAETTRYLMHRDTCSLSKCATQDFRSIAENSSNV